jgi:hypothetical protein
MARRAASFNVAALLFHGNGLAVGPAFLPALSGASNDNLIDENVAALANGNFVVVWVDSLIQNGNSLSTVHAQIYQPNLTGVGGPITVMPQFPGQCPAQPFRRCRMGFCRCGQHRPALRHLRTSVSGRRHQARGAGKYWSSRSRISPHRRADQWRLGRARRQCPV